MESEVRRNWWAWSLFDVCADEFVDKYRAGDYDHHSFEDALVEISEMFPEVSE